MPILDGDFIYGTAIDAHAPRSVLLWYQQNRYSAWAKALSNIALFHEFVDLTLKLFGFFGIGSVCWPIRNNSSGHKIDLVLNPTKWWQTTWHFIWKNVFEINDYAYQINLPCEYNVSATFNVIDFSLIVQIRRQILLRKRGMM